MQAKSVALLLVGILLISSVFVFFNVDYPSQPATLIIHPPKNVKPPPEIIFGNQTYNSQKLGQNVTSFSPTGNASVNMVGYAYGKNSTGKTPLADQKIYVAVMEVIVSTRTNSSGFYSIQVMKAGSGVFAFKAFQFSTTYLDVFIPSSGVYWLNVTMPQSPKYNVSGNTISTNGTVGDVAIKLTGYYGQYSFSSALSGSFEQFIVNGTYKISVIKPGFSNVTSPEVITVSGSTIKNESIFLHPITSAIYRISGYVRNDLGYGIANATVYSSTLKTSVKTGSNGFYSIDATYGSNILQFSGYQYVTAGANVTATKNTTHNQSMESKNPFWANSPAQSSNILIPPVPMGNNLSKVNYTITPEAQQPVQVMDGYLQSNQTGQKLADLNFTALTSVNGTYSYYEFSTNADGYFSVNFSYTGEYHLVIESSRFPEFNMSSLQNQGGSFQVNTSSGLFSVSGTVGNPLSGNGITGVSIGIGVSPGSSPVINFSSNSTGNFSGRLLGGTYYLHFSRPGYLNRTVEINLTGNTTIPRVNLTPADIGPGFEYWSASSGTGLPGISPANVTSAINASSPSQASSYSDAPVNFTVHIVNSTGE
ncbi:MAG: carboxypeptidase regulatory-like domain-containing protein, partial [Thermoplasmataceae archaeon]